MDTQPVKWCQLTALIIDAVVMVSDNVFQGLGQGCGTPFNLVHPIGGRTGNNLERGFTVMEQFMCERHRRWQSQQGRTYRVRMDWYHKQYFVRGLSVCSFDTFGLEAFDVFLTVARFGP